MEFHFYQLPFNKTYLRLEDQFRIELFDKAKNNFSSYNQLAKKLKCCSLSLLNWKNGKTAIPTVMIISLFRIINEKEFNLKNLEEKITELMSGRKSKKNGSIGKSINCQFPLKISPKLARILAHIMGDGTININWYFNTIYFNKQIELINEVECDLREIFGDVKLNINKGKDEVYYMNIPSIIGMILYHWFGDFSSEKIKVPKLILNSDLNTQSKFLQGIFDDEGTLDIRYKTIRFGSKSKNLANSCCLLLKNFGIKPTNVYKIKYITRINKLKGFMYNFGITNKRGINIFNERIGFNHIKKKDLLNNFCNSKI
ncbi:MAG: hypothetical protein KJ674_01045 [Nanoarchaeota archaeon]|nr:hypothetical protein [Nanoarchaeota archaeon]